MLASLIKKLGVKFSLNDPRWGRGAQDSKENEQQPEQRPSGGKKPTDGPPDLDQLWRDFNQSLNNFLVNKAVAMVVMVVTATVCPMRAELV